MSMSTSVLGFKPPDEKWRQMKAIYDACTAAGVEVPSEVSKFFDYCPPDEMGVMVEEDELEECGALREYNEESGSGYEIVLEKLPPDVKVIRFVNSW